MRERNDSSDGVLPARHPILADRLFTNQTFASVQARLFGPQASPLYLHRYRIVRVLGSGVTGRVYAAYDPDLDRRVALKVFNPSTRAMTARQRWLREARALAKLDHPNIVKVYDIVTGGTSGDDPTYIVMELVDGPSLAPWLSDHPRTWSETLAIFLDAGEGLQAAHAHGLIHRDFKPSNVVIGKEGRPRVVDFGLAKHVEQPDLRAERLPPTDHLLWMTLTDSGAVMGTPLYMAPEQHEGALADARSDQYSFALALCEALLRRYPFVRSDLRALVSSKTSMHLDRAVKDLPPNLQGPLLRALAPDPTDRFGTMRELLAALERAVPRKRRLRRRTMLHAFALASMSLIVSDAAMPGASAVMATNPCCTPGDTVTWTLDPAATYYRTSDEYAATGSSPIALEEHGVCAGDKIELRVIGRYFNSKWPSLRPASATVTFSASSELLPADARHRIPSAIAATEPYVSPRTHSGELVTDIPEDFAARGVVTVPDEAHYLFASVIDSYFSDNAPGPDGVALKITCKEPTARDSGAPPLQ